MRRCDCNSCRWLSALQRKIRTHFAIPTQHRAPEQTVKPLVIFCVSCAEEASRRQSGLGRRNCLELLTLPAASEPRSTAMPDGPACWATQRQLTEQPSLLLAFRPLTCSLARLAGRRGADSSPLTPPLWDLMGHRVTGELQLWILLFNVETEWHK